MGLSGNSTDERAVEPAQRMLTESQQTQLLRQAARGDRQAFSTLVDLHAQPLFRIALTLIGNRSDAEDLVQETLAGALESAGGFRGEASVRTWLTRILFRQAAKQRRRNWRNRSLPIESAEQVGSPGAAGSVDRRLDVLAVLQTLSPEHREVIVLREYQAMSYDEMAKILGVPRGTIESRLHRARQELKDKLKGYK